MQQELRVIKLELPVYYNTGKTTVLFGMNWSRNAHFHILNKSKKHYHKIVADKLSEFEKIDGKFKVRYVYFYKNSSSDAPNVVSQIEKVFLDAIQEIGLVENDNVKFHTAASWKVGGEDKINPRVEIILYKD